MKIRESVALQFLVFKRLPNWYNFMCLYSTKVTEIFYKTIVLLFEFQRYILMMLV